MSKAIQYAQATDNAKALRPEEIRILGAFTMRCLDNGSAQLDLDGQKRVFSGEQALWLAAWINDVFGPSEVITPAHKLGELAKGTL